MKTAISREVRFQLPHTTLAGKVWGDSSGIPVLALHGWLDNANSFDHLAPFWNRLQVVAVDLAGHGLSDHRNSYYLWDHLADVAGVVRHLGWNRFCLMGHSMGAGIATWYAGTFPKKVQRLALIDGFGAAFSVEAEQLPRYLNRAIRQLQMSGRVPIDRFAEGGKAQFASFGDAVAERMNGKFGKLSETAAKTLLQRGLQPVEGGFRWRNDPRIALPALMEPSEAAIHAMIRNIQAPTCLVLGDRGLFGRGEKADRLRSFAELEVHTLPGSHHLHLEEEAPQVAALTESFFYQISSTFYKNIMKHTFDNSPDPLCGHLLWADCRVEGI